MNSLHRDCLIYGITVVVLIVVLVDEKVYWYESLVMISVYVVYIVLMMFNAKIERWALSSKTSVSKRFHSQTGQFLIQALFPTIFAKLR